MKIRQKKTPSQLSRNKGTHRILLDEVSLAMTWETVQGNQIKKITWKGMRIQEECSVYKDGWLRATALNAVETETGRPK